MSWRLVQFIIFFAIIFLFIVFNLENKCDISFGFTVIKNAPVFLTAFSSFFIGMLCVLPFIFAFRARKKVKTTREKGLLAKASKKQSKDSGTKYNENPAGNAADSGLFDKTHYGID
jgi:uncharacterized integral membrane protein